MPESTDVYVTENKLWYTSKIFWFAVFMETITLIELNLNVLQPYIDGNIYAYLIFTFGVGIKLLRFITTQGIKI